MCIAVGRAESGNRVAVASLAEKAAALEDRVPEMDWKEAYRQYNELYFEFMKFGGSERLRGTLQTLRLLIAGDSAVAYYRPVAIRECGAGRGAITGLGAAAGPLAQQAPQRKLQEPVKSERYMLAVTEVYDQLSLYGNPGRWAQFVGWINVYEMDGKLKPLKMADPAENAAELRDAAAAALGELTKAEEAMQEAEEATDAELEVVEPVARGWYKTYPRLKDRVEEEIEAIEKVHGARNAFEEQASKYVAAQNKADGRKALYEIFLDLKSGTFAVLYFGFLKEVQSE